MENFNFTSDNKRYHALSYHLKKKYNSRIFKAALNAGFTCPNIDGTKGFGGCTFCDGSGAYFADNGFVPIDIQLENEITRIHKKNNDAKVIAYFQSNSNTYTNATTLKQMLDKVLENENVIGVAIATRADCLELEIVKLLKFYSKKTYLTVELGLQTVFDETAKLVNRCHSYNDFLAGYNKLKENGIRVCVHIINGLPGENSEMMLQTAKEVGLLKPDAIKIHLLHVIKDTPLANLYFDEKFDVLSKDEYVDIVVRQLELIPKTTVIERLTGDGDKTKLIAPLWSSNKKSVFAAIDKMQVQLDSWQGKKLQVIH